MNTKKKLINAFLVVLLGTALCLPAINTPAVTVDYAKDSNPNIINNTLTAGVSLALSDTIDDTMEEIFVASINKDIPMVGVTMAEAEGEQVTIEAIAEEVERQKELLPYDEVDPYTAWVGFSWVNMRKEPKKKAKVLDELAPRTSLTIIGETDDGWLAVDIDDSDDVGYVYSEYIMNVEPESTTYNDNWSGKKLNSKRGRVHGPSGDETFYNLNMSGCERLMNSLGYYASDIWVRSDGVKMWDQYVMVAANLKVYPKGTIVETSLGKGIVVDTGSFVTNGSGVTFDIAVTW